MHLGYFPKESTRKGTCFNRCREIPVLYLFVALEYTIDPGIH